ncbi:TonB-dependent receptor [Bowmanella dokdonensis]|uniref:TonB-dependent receptor n=1 Tax=Bowmanella dokdonensis TaxID=751969 RepID=A0A939INW7_9ALTE|nr:TonB-dependent receptor [Bowmanella dokdonensis]MBN7825285.1 TonB-dependent receptor [Bowmanella dokdonensis]
MQAHHKSRLALLISAALLSAPALAQQAAQDEAKDNKLKEESLEVIEVTGSGRLATAAEIPMNISAVGAAELRRKNITDIKDLIADSVEISAPGNSSRFAESVTVRGLNVSPVNANNLEQFARTTVAYYLDDTPLPNIGYRIKDINRVEKLLGPQGTLYGGGSLGGTIRYITNQPVLDEFSFDANASLFQVKNGGLSHDTDFVINLPISDTLAVRASVANLDDAGFTDRIANPVYFPDALKRIPDPNPNQELYEDDDWEETTGGKIALLWQPSDDFTLTLSHIQQDQLAHGTTGASRLTVDYACEQEGLEGEACDAKYSRYTTPFQVNDHTIVATYEEYSDRELSLDSIDFDWQLDFARLHSSTSYFEDSRKGQADYLGYGLVYYGWIPDLALDATNESAYITFDNTYKGFNHETRLTSNDDGPLTWIAGIFHTDTEKRLIFSEFYPGFDEATNNFYGFDRQAWYGDTRPGSVDEGYHENFHNQYQETALFGELTWAATDKLDLTLGARIFRYEDENEPLIVDYTGVTNSRSSSETSGTESFFKFNAAYQMTDTLLAYATFSQGFRRGGTNGFKDDTTTDQDGNTVPLTVSEGAQNYDPDSTNNYELGIKGFMLDRDLYMQANVYRIEWDDVQTYFSQTLDGIFPLNGTTNGPSAKTEGFEFSSRYQLSDEITLRYAAARTEGEWTETAERCVFDPVPNAPEADLQCRTWEKGGNLGGTPKWRHNFGVSYDTNFEVGYLSVNLDGRYVGETPSDRKDSIDSEVYTRDSYTLYNASVSYGRDDWKVSLWVDNLTDELAETSGQTDLGQGWRTIFVRPRTVGVNLSYTYY